MKIFVITSWVLKNHSVVYKDSEIFLISWNWFKMSWLSHQLDNCFALFADDVSSLRMTSWFRFSMNLMLAYLEHHLITCFVVSLTCLHSHSEKSKSEIFCLCRKFARLIFSVRIWVMMKLSFLHSSWWMRAWSRLKKSRWNSSLNDWCLSHCFFHRVQMMLFALVYMFVMWDLSDALTSIDLFSFFNHFSSQSVSIDFECNKWFSDWCALCVKSFALINLQT
jgi:hypothetical protein